MAFALARVSLRSSASASSVPDTSSLNRANDRSLPIEKRGSASGSLAAVAKPSTVVSAHGIPASATAAFARSSTSIARPFG